MKSLKFYLFLSFVALLNYSSSCLAGKEFSDEEFTTFTKKIGYQFKDRKLLSGALTHSSVPRKEAEIDEFQRLEHVGDRVLNLVIAEYLYEKYPEKNEGYLAEEGKKFISNEYVLNVATKLNLLNDVDYVVDKNNPNVGLDKISYTACEALIGAIYLDNNKNLKPANNFIRTHFIASEPTVKDLKEFQKICEYKVLNPLSYYEVTVTIENRAFIGKGSSKRSAKQLAAKAAYNDLTKTKVGRDKAIQALEKKFPQKEFSIVRKENNEAEIKVSYEGHTATGKGESLKKAKTEATKKLYEHVKSLSGK